MGPMTAPPAPRRCTAALLCWTLALVAGACGSTSRKPGPGGPPAAGARPVELSLPRLGGGRIEVQQLRGRPVVITMFTTWCLRCQAEAPRFVELHERHGARLALLGLAMDVRGFRLIKTYVDHVGFRFPVMLAPPNDLDLVTAMGKTRRVPRTLLLDRQGRIALDHQGYTDFAQLHARINGLLKHR